MVPYVLIRMAWPLVPTVNASWTNVTAMRTVITEVANWTQRATAAATGQHVKPTQAVSTKSVSATRIITIITERVNSTIHIIAELMIINAQITVAAIPQPVNAYARPENTCITENVKVTPPQTVAPTETLVRLSNTGQKSVSRANVHLCVIRPILAVLRPITAMNIPAKRMT